jgi:hypothetical protein
LLVVLVWVGYLNIGLVVKLQAVEAKLCMTSREQLPRFW